MKQPLVGYYWFSTSRSKRKKEFIAKVVASRIDMSDEEIPTRLLLVEGCDKSLEGWRDIIGKARTIHPRYVVCTPTSLELELI